MDKLDTCAHVSHLMQIVIADFVKTNKVNIEKGWDSPFYFYTELFGMIIGSQCASKLLPEIKSDTEKTKEALEMIIKHTTHTITVAFELALTHRD